MTLVFKINTGLFYFKASCSVCLRGQSVESSATGRCYSLCRICRVVNKATGSSNLPTLSPPQTREQEELEELLLQEQQSNEQRRLEVLQEEQRQLQAKRKNKQALLDELVRCPRCMAVCMCNDKSSDAISESHYDRCSMSDVHALGSRVRGCEIIKSLLPVIVLQVALFSFCDSKAYRLHCVELQALKVIVPAERAAEGPSQIAG